MKTVKLVEHSPWCESSGLRLRPLESGIAIRAQGQASLGKHVLEIARLGLERVNMKITRAHPLGKDIRGLERCIVS